MINILVTGANGQLGSEIRKISGLFPEMNFSFTDVAELDITNTEKVTEFLSGFKPEFLVNCAAYTNVDKAETDIPTSTLLNATAVGIPVSYTHLRAHETRHDIVCRLLLD